MRKLADGSEERPSSGTTRSCSGDDTWFSADDDRGGASGLAETRSDPDETETYYSLLDESQPIAPTPRAGSSSDTETGPFLSEYELRALRRPQAAGGEAGNEPPRVGQ